MRGAWPASLRVSIGNEADNEAFLEAMRTYVKKSGKV
jgi:histidinol-phosphate/aromatic aminotransferase/cobyric acid decarboxylase-like protein